MTNKIDLNRASADEISNIDGITKETAEAIVDYRENKKGNIERLDELAGLNGLDYYLMENIRNSTDLG
ncbi:MAG: ComEA family DNA-binding protein [Candidatus Cyclobacteriaceae bacterium M2_1C_046]